jgi:cofilin
LVSQEKANQLKKENKMSNSGAKLHPDCVTMFNEFKGNSNKPTHDFLILKLDGINIIPDLCPLIGTSSEDPRFENSEHPAFDHMVSHLLEKGSGYAFYIFRYDKGNGRRSKLVFYTYVDDNGPAKTKMTMTSSKTAVEKGCPGFSIKIMANSKEDLSYKVGLDLVLEHP